MGLLPVQGFERRGGAFTKSALLFLNCNHLHLCYFFKYHHRDSRQSFQEPPGWSIRHPGFWRCHCKGKLCHFFTLSKPHDHLPQVPNGFFLLGPRPDDIRISNGLQVLTTSTSALDKISVGDLVSVDGKVQEFRPDTSPNDLFATRVTSATNIVVLSSNNTFSIITLGKDRSPPTQYLSALDIGFDGFLSRPNNVSLVGVVNPELQPELYGLDFWESLEGQIVTIPNPIATNFENKFGEFWVYGGWPITGMNGRGGITITFGRVVLLSLCYVFIRYRS